MKKFVSFLVAVISVIFNTDINDINISAYASDFPEFSYSENISYNDYYNLYSDSERPECEININAVDYKSAQNVHKDRNTLIIDDAGSAVYDIYVAQSGIYCVEITYCPLISNSPDIEFSLSINGNIPYDTASRLVLNRIWTDDGEIKLDSKGNQIRPFQIQQEMQTKSFLNDTDGLFSEPLVFYLEKGENQISLNFERASLEIENIVFCQPDYLKSYDEYIKSYDVNNSADNKIRTEGENAVYKSSSVLCPTYDNSDYMVSPSDYNNLVYNTIGDESWNKSFQSITWRIPKEEIKTGLYKIGIKARQDEMRGFCSSRRIYIDGKIPFEEFNQVKFQYSSDWILNSFDEYIYLDSSCDHFITLEAVPDKDLSEYLRRLESALFEINEYYRNIIMITGVQPDKYTDYYVHEKIPNLLSDFERISGELKEIKKGIEDIYNSYGSEASAVTGMTNILDKCIKKPLKIPQYVSEIHDNISTLSAWERDCRKTPLEIDYIELCTENQEFSDTEKSFFKSLKFGFCSFVSSFFTDYSSFSNTDSDCIEVWVNSGREQAQIIRELSESEFMTENPDISISVKLVSGGILESAMAGYQPDVVLFAGGEMPVNLASRGLLVNLEEFDDYSEIKKRFQKNSSVNYEYNNGCYGLPLSQSWAMMFYREDILKELGFSSPPETWQELIDMLPAIQRNYMSVGLVLPSNNVSPVTETGNTFACLLLQKDINYYNSELNKSVLDSAECVSAFEQWTDFYRKYGFMQSYDAFSRFRTGEYPIIIADYTLFNKLEELAPEIKGLWNFTSVPGTLKDDGTVSHAENSNGTSAIIFNKDEDKKYKSWEFIKWFTSSEIQTEYSNRLEGIMGVTARFPTANTEALESLSWSYSELEQLINQREELEEIPIITSSYAVTRNIMNAFRETVNNGQNPGDTLIWYNRDINNEIKRKLKNEGQVLK